MFKYEMRNVGKTNRFIHWEFRVGIFRISFYKMKKQLTIRFEISKGWDK